MADFTYYAPAKDVSEIDPDKLRHRYFVQLAPDGRHLVPGMLQQDCRPDVGRWLEVGRITRDLPKRYFVQYTDMDTLVPGSLIEARQLPPGSWKELKKNAPGFYRVLFYDGIYTHEGIDDVVVFTDAFEFNTNKVIPVLGLVYPEIDLEETYLDYRLYYFQGTFEDLGNDPSKLTLFSGLDAVLRLNVIMEGIGFTDTFSTNILSNAEFSVAPVGIDGSYCIVLGILNGGNEVVDYVVLEDVFYMTVFGPR